MKTFLLLILLLNGCTYETIEQETPEMTSSRGATATLTPGTGAKLVFQPAAFAEEGNYTVQFKVRDPNSTSNLQSGDKIAALATITWTVGGSPVSRIVDVADGVSVSGTAEAVNVSVADNSTFNPTTIVKPYDVTVVVGKGVRAPVQQPPTFALPRDSIAPAASSTFNVPQDAGAISVNIAIAPGLGGTIGAYQVLAQHWAQGTPLKTYDPRQSDWVPLMPGTTQIRIVCDAALATNTLVQVTFGIDG